MCRIWITECEEWFKFAIAKFTTVCYKEIFQCLTQRATNFDTKIQMNRYTTSSTASQTTHIPKDWVNIQCNVSCSTAHIPINCLRAPIINVPRASLRNVYTHANIFEASVWFWCFAVMIDRLLSHAFSNATAKTGLTSFFDDQDDDYLISSRLMVALLQKSKHCTIFDRIGKV